LTTTSRHSEANGLEDHALVLGIETSCDETAAAVVAADGAVLSNLVLSQVEMHRPYGGVVPEIAARAHVDHLDGLIARAVAEAGTDFGKLAAVAATSGPGLVGGVMVGMVTGKAIAAARQLPFIAVNHLEAHALTIRLTDRVPFPYLLLLVSGGHCQLLSVLGVGDYRRLGTTIDDAIGEAFDKTANLIGLGYPGGPAVEKAAALGDPKRFKLPRPLKGRPGCDFSFSGLKTAVRRTVEALDQKILSPEDTADLAAGFQAAAGDVLCDRVGHAIKAHCKLLTGAMRDQPGILVVAGGVAANQYLRDRVADVAADEGFRFMAPPRALCTDNAVMVAWTGVERLRLGMQDDLNTPPRARWPLDPTAPPATGAGVKA
jgi:N6-L-threonylcarbamoyladenine synthase